MSQTDYRISPPSPAEPVPEEFDLLCEQCSYSLIGLVDSNRCPECGREFDPKTLPLARVPWLYRRRLGKFRAFWQTAWYVIGQPSGFARELCRPVRISAADARAFRACCIWIAAASVFVPVILGMTSFALFIIVRRGWPVGDDAFNAMLFYLFGTMVAIVVSWAYFTLATDLPTFIWKGLSQNRKELAPLHHYAAAPMIFMPIYSLVLIATALASHVADDPEILAFAGIAAPIFFVVQLIVVCDIAAVLMRAATQCSAKRAFGLIAYIVFHWFLLIAVGALAALVILLALANWLD